MDSWVKMDPDPKYEQTIRPLYVYFPTIPEPVNNKVGDPLISST